MQPARNVWSKAALYPTHQESELVLKETAANLGITGYSMAKLLGMRHNNYQRYFNGAHRPSSQKMAHIAALLLLRLQGLPVGLVDRIDWSRKLIVWKPGVTLGEYRMHDGLQASPINAYIETWEPPNLA